MTKDPGWQNLAKEVRHIRQSVNHCGVVRRLEGSEDWPLALIDGPETTSGFPPVCTSGSTARLLRHCPAAENPFSRQWNVASLRQTNAHGIALPLVLIIGLELLAQAREFHPHHRVL